MLIRSTLLAMALTVGASAQTTDATLDPQTAIAKSDANPRADTKVRIAMQVAATGREGHIVFLNSSADYRAPDDLTVRLAPNVVKDLTKRYGAAPETYLQGKRVVVTGTLRRAKIVNSEYGRATGFNRWQHIVPVLFTSQIVSVD